MHALGIGPSRLVLVWALMLIVTANAAFSSPAFEQYKFVRKWGAQAAGGALDGPFGVAVDAGGNVFVVDSLNFRIEKFDHTGRFLLAWGNLGHRTGEFWYACGVAVDASVVSAK